MIKITIETILTAIFPGELGFMGVRTNSGVRGRRGKARRAESGDGVLGEGTASPSPPTRQFAGAL